MTRYKMPFFMLLFFSVVRMGAATTLIPETIQLNGFSATYKINDPHSWNVSVPADKNSVSYKYAESGTEGMAEFIISRVVIRARLRMENAATVANDIIKQNVETALRKTYENKITLLRDTVKKSPCSGNLLR